MRLAAVAAVAAIVIASGCISSQTQSQSALPLAEEASSATPLPPTYVVIAGGPGPFKDNSSSEWFITYLGVEYRADDFETFHPLFDVYVEKDGAAVFNRLGISGEETRRGFFTSAALELTNKPVFLGYAGNYTVRVQMRKYRSHEVNYTATKIFSLP